MGHLAHCGVVAEPERERRFAWRAPFSEWIRAYTADMCQMTGFREVEAGQFPRDSYWENKQTLNAVSRAG